MSSTFEALFVVIDALLLASFRSCFDVVFYLLSEPLGVGFELRSRPSDRQLLVIIIISSNTNSDIITVIS